MEVQEPERGVEPHLLTLADALQLLLETYTPSERLILDVAELKVLNRAVEHLQTWHLLEEDECALAFKLVQRCWPVMGQYARNAPVVYDALMQAWEEGWLQRNVNGVKNVTLS